MNKDSYGFIIKGSVVWEILDGWEEPEEDRGISDICLKGYKYNVLATRKIENSLELGLVD